MKKPPCGGFCASTEILADPSKAMKKPPCGGFCASTEILADPSKAMKKPPCGGFCASTEIRTPVLALKGLRPGPLDDGGINGRILPSHPLLVKKKRDIRSISFTMQPINAAGRNHREDACIGFV